MHLTVAYFAAVTQAEDGTRQRYLKPQKLYDDSDLVAKVRVFNERLIETNTGRQTIKVMGLLSLFLSNVDMLWQPPVWRQPA